MALYIPASTRRRRTALIVVAAAVVGLLVGLLVGKLLAPSVGDTVRAKQDQVNDLVARLDGMGLEYQQQSSGGTAGASDARQGSIDAARGIVGDTGRVVDSMPWVSPTERAKVTTAVKAVQAAVEAGVPPARLTGAITAAETALRDASGAAAPAS
jgi:hypothetical protein